MSRFLAMSGHTILSAVTMREALDALPTSNCEVLICDISLPDGDGWELLPLLKMPGPIYAIAVSGYGSPADRERSLAAGFRRHLLKPFVQEQLAAALAEASRELPRID